GRQDAVISDIGGTTTDIAILRSGRPALSDDGATVGGHATMVTAVAMTTHGLGGDSEIHVDDAALTPRLILGPRRVIPISLLAELHPDAVKPVLRRQLDQTAPGAYDARFLFRNPGARGADALRDQDRAVLEAIPETPIPAAQAIRNRLQANSVNRLIGMGMVRASGLTPSDAARILGLHDNWDLGAARDAATLIARKRDARGGAIAADAEAMASFIRQTLQRRSAEVLLDAALAADGIKQTAPSMTPLGAAALDGWNGAARIDIGLALPLIGLGASAPAYYPAIADLLRTQADVPPDADVANAIGAVVGQVRILREAVISRPNDGIFRVHTAPENADFPDLDRALDHARQTLTAQAQSAASAAGADEIELAEDWQPKVAHIEGKPVFIEGTARITATGRPRLAG
ncbi:MAG: hydantoinase/oxoprolinase family protein, partial [Pseudomonadota bacterium]